MTYKNIPVIIVAGIGAKTRVIGNDNQLLFHVPDDLKRFKELSMGHPIIIGRKTFESIVAMIGKPLPGRTNIVVTRDESYSHEGTKVAHSLERAFELAAREYPREIHIGGGAEMYKQALPYVDKLFLTLFESEAEGDTFFPEYAGDFEEIARHETREHQGLKYQWVNFERRK
ncbi:MAG: dihydrofolate reductase [Candidatus Paceibacterota bacterium]